VEWYIYHREVKIFDNITEALSDVTWTSFYYSYSCRFCLNENNEKVSLHTHAHSFDEVVRDLYDYPESFKISKGEEDLYSQQELEIRLVGEAFLKDIRSNPEKYEYLCKDVKRGSLTYVGNDWEKK